MQKRKVVPNTLSFLFKVTAKTWNCVKFKYERI